MLELTSGESRAELFINVNRFWSLLSLSSTVLMLSINTELKKAKLCWIIIVLFFCRLESDLGSRHIQLGTTSRDCGIRGDQPSLVLLQILRFGRRTMHLRMRPLLVLVILLTLTTDGCLARTLNAEAEGENHEREKRAIGDFFTKIWSIGSLGKAQYDDTSSSLAKVYEILRDSFSDTFIRKVFKIGFKLNF